MISSLLAFLIAAILLTLSPGPDIIYVWVQSMSNGKKAGILTAAGLASGVMVHTCLLAFGVSALIRQSPIIYTSIKWVGAFYLFYLAWQVYRSEAGLNLEVSQDNQQKKAWQFYIRGFIMNIINPKVILFFLAFFPGFLWNPESHPEIQFFILGGLFLVQAFLIFCCVALLADRIAKGLRNNQRAAFVFKWMQVLVFVGIGGFILW